MALLGFREDTMACEGAQDTVEGMGLDTNQGGQLLTTFRPVFEKVGDAESGSDVDQLTQPMGENHVRHGLYGRLLDCLVGMTWR